MPNMPHDAECRLSNVDGRGPWLRGSVLRGLPCEVAGVFEAPSVLAQMRCAGILEVGLERVRSYATLFLNSYKKPQLASSRSASSEFLCDVIS